MGSYEQAMKHSKNHRKNRCYQQCGFSIADKGVKSYTDIAERTATAYYVGTQSGKRLTENFLDSDEAVLALQMLREQTPDRNVLDLMCIYTDKNMLLMKE